MGSGQSSHYPAKAELGHRLIGPNLTFKSLGFYIILTSLLIWKNSLGAGCIPRTWRRARVAFIVRLGENMLPHQSPTT